MRLFYAGDVHGSEKLWRKFVNAAGFYRCDVLVMGGDLTGKVLVPVVEVGRGRWEARLSGRLRRARGDSEVAELERWVRFNGFYPVRCSPEEYERIGADPERRDALFRSAMRDELARWIDIAVDRLEGSGVRLLLMPGNDDEWDIDEVIDKAPEPVIPCEGRIVVVEGVQFLSSALANPTPWNSPRELPEDELYATLSRLVQDLDPGLPVVLNLHCPPYDSGLDLAPELTDDLRVVTEGAEARLVPVGSRAVRRVIEELQPPLGLHGHIHESRGARTIGRTLCINPGSAYGEGVLDGAIVELQDGEVVSYQLVSG